MLDSFKKPLADAVDDLRHEAERRKETTPSDVSIEAWEFAARRFERAIAEAEQATQTLTPAEYAEVHHISEQTVTRWIRVGELEAERMPGGYAIACDAKRRERVRKAV